MTKNGPTTRVVVDGYHIGSHTLSGIKFHADIIEDKLVVTVAPESVTDYEDFKMGNWVDEMKCYILDHTVFDTPDGQEAWLETDENVW